VVVVEGEEETDSHLGQLVHDQPHLFDADVYVIADGGNEQVGVPVLEVTTRGLVQLGLEVSTLRAPVHSGLFGGAAPDALIVLIRMLATLHDDVGNVAVTGLHQYPWPGDDTDHEVFRRAAGIETRVELVGDGSLASRLWSRPAISVIGIDAPPTQGAVNALVPQARATISMRVAPGADPEVEEQLLRDHLRAVAPWGAHVSITQGQLGPSWSTGTDGPVLALAREAMSAAFGAEPGVIGSGGAIPLLSALQQVNPHAEFVLWGAEDGAAANIHSANESVDLAELERALLASCLLLLGLAAPTTPGS
jgi:acetylornithine deacetylase/succinyl-diaminopimelate desuccinylase-like protein